MHTDLKALIVEAGSSVKEAVAKIDAARIGIVLVVDTEKRLLGTITDGDVRRAILANFDLNLSVSRLLARKSGSPYARPISASPGSDPSVYLGLMQEHGVSHLPIIDRDRRVVGLVTMEEFLPNNILPIQAVIMAGGEGTRLRPLTLDTPKPMLPVGDRPLMELIIERLEAAGIRKVNITTHYKAEEISDYFKDGNRFGVEVSYLREDSPLGTCGGLGLLGPINETTLVINGDIFSQVDFRAMVAYHREHGADMTVAVSRYKTQIPYGVVECEGPTVQNIMEKPVLEFFINAGIYLLEPVVYGFIPKGQRLEMTDLVGHLINAGRVVVGFPVREQWLDVGAHEDYKKAQEYAQRKYDA